MMEVGSKQYSDSLTSMLNAMPERVIRYKTPELTILYCNLAWADGHGRSPSDVIGRNLIEFLTPFELGVLRGHLAELTPQNPIIVNGAHSPNDVGEWVDWVDRFLPNAETGDEVLAVGRDGTRRHVAELELVASEARFRELAERSADIVWRLKPDPTPHFEYISPAVTHVLGYAPEWFLCDFTRFLDILEDGSRDVVVAALVGGFPLERTDLRFRCADGRLVIGETVATPVSGGLQGVCRDVTELRRLQDSLTSLALRDPLTGLGNRRLLDELLDQALARSASSGGTLCVIFVDLDRLKTVNDTYGHEAGDTVLRTTAQRLLGTVRKGEVVARIGGDEFVIVCGIDRAGAESLIERIEAVLAEPIAISATATTSCPASIGIADTVSVGFDAAALLAAADSSMYAVKESRRRRSDS